ncbi:DUF4189 domain-containing protein [uncultured Ramlibacter sp.]|uniref:DUF4189 domain-containing protein n=1 Tax=uncultured Ramlibacter sp. TaxID=260755 RepID=UPI002621D7C3|nr:DUF4189 domain-containing protein [uncultured Ramlibacter sp.]
MANLKTSWRLLCLAPFFALPSLAHAQYSAIAWGTGDHKDKGSWAHERTQEEANRKALEFCNARLENINCKLSSTKAVARAVSPSNVGFGRSEVSLADAEQNALNTCGEGCEVNFRLAKPGFYALARSEEDANGDVKLRLFHQGDNLGETSREAVRSCENGSGRRCQVRWEGAIDGKIEPRAASKPAPIVKAEPRAAAKPTPVAKAEPQPKNCRPQTASIRCSSQCVNGNCVVSYENGCKMRVQVQSQYDGLSNSWKYPSPAC